MSNNEQMTWTPTPEQTSMLDMLGLTPAAICAAKLRKDDSVESEAKLIAAWGEENVTAGHAAILATRHETMARARAATIARSADPNKPLIKGMLADAWTAMLGAYSEHYAGTTGIPCPTSRGGAWPADLMDYLSAQRHPDGTMRRKTVDGRKVIVDLGGTPKGSFGLKVTTKDGRAVNISVRMDGAQPSRKGAGVTEPTEPTAEQRAAIEQRQHEADIAAGDLSPDEEGAAMELEASALAQALATALYDTDSAPQTSEGAEE